MVQVIKTPDRYRCQTCGAAYDELWRAELCESIPVAPINHNIGDTIRVTTRYDGIVEARVIGTFMVNYQNEAMERCRDRDHFYQILSRKENLLPQHGYGILVGEELEMGKGGYTDRILLWSLVKD